MYVCHDYLIVIRRAASVGRGRGYEVVVESVDCAAAADLLPLLLWSGGPKGKKLKFFENHKQVPFVLTPKNFGISPLPQIKKLY